MVSSQVPPKDVSISTLITINTVIIILFITFMDQLEPVNGTKYQQNTYFIFNLRDDIRLSVYNVTHSKFYISFCLWCNMNSLLAICSLLFLFENYAIRFSSSCWNVLCQKDIFWVLVLFDYNKRICNEKFWTLIIGYANFVYSDLRNLIHGKTTSIWNRYISHRIGNNQKCICLLYGTMTLHMLYYGSPKG